MVAKAIAPTTTSSRSAGDQKLPGCPASRCFILPAEVRRSGRAADLAYRLRGVAIPEAMEDQADHAAADRGFSLARSAPRRGTPVRQDRRGTCRPANNPAVPGFKPPHHTWPSPQPDLRQHPRLFQPRHVLRHSTSRASGSPKERLRRPRFAPHIQAPRRQDQARS